MARMPLPATLTLLLVVAAVVGSLVLKTATGAAAGLALRQPPMRALGRRDDEKLALERWKERGSCRLFQDS